MSICAYQFILRAQVWRYYLLANRPEQSDTTFLWDDLAAKNNNELLANLGNFVNRALSFTAAKFHMKVPVVEETCAEADELSDKV